MFNVEDKVKEFKAKHRNKCFALANWKNLKMKDFGMIEMLTCICNAANGSLSEMANIIEHLTSKNKVFGRTQVYNDDNVNTIDIVRGENGELILKGYNPEAELPLKGQHQKRNPKIFRKTDDKTNKIFQNAEERMYNLGEKVRELFPGEDNHFITFAMQAIRKYAEEKKIHTDKVIKGLQKERYRLDTDMWRIVPNVQEENKQRKHTIFVNESDIARISDMFVMTPQKFQSNIKRFISQLLADPVNAKVPDIFAIRKISRSLLLKYLLSGKDPILIRHQTICDKDENGEPKTATMKIKFERPLSNDDSDYKCPRKNFERKLEKLYMRMFEKNLPPRKTKSTEEVEVDEATACGGAGVNADGAGQFITPMSKKIISRQMPTELDETATTDVGKYEYTAPAFGDEESCARHDGEGGSVSINHTDK